MTNIERKLRANLTKLYLLNASWMFLVLMPVIVPFFQHHGLQMQQIYTLLTIFATSVVILEVPSGYISDLLGRKNTLVLCGIFQGIAFTILALSATFPAFVVFELFNAVSVSLFSGTDVALIYDSLQNLKSKTSEASALARRVFYSQVGETVAALIGGALVAISITLPAKINAITGWLPLVVALTLYEPERTKLDHTRHWQNAKYIYRKLFRESKLLRLVILNYISFGLASYIVVWAFQGYWRDIGIPLQYFGYLWAAYNLTVALSGRIAHRIEIKLGSVRTLILMGLLPVLAYLGMAVFSSIIGIVLGLMLKFCRGLNQVVIRDALNSRVGTEMRATANSVMSLGVRLIFAALGPLMGYMIDNRGYSFAFAVFAAIYLLSSLFLLLPLVRQRAHFRTIEDPYRRTA